MPLAGVRPVVGCCSCYWCRLSGGTRLPLRHGTYCSRHVLKTAAILAGALAGVTVMVRVLTLVAGLIIALPASAGEMTASEASIQSRGAGLMRYGTMPLGTLRVEGQRVCASLPGAAIQPCFYLERTTAESFRGSIAGLGLCLLRLHTGAHDVGELTNA